MNIEPTPPTVKNPPEQFTQGVALFGDRDGNIIEVRPGQTLYTPPGQDHWHAAAPGCFVEHIAMLSCVE
jgi:quercetin dioxygenase-like cupin family protein